MLGKVAFYKLLERYRGFRCTKVLKGRNHKANVRGAKGKLIRSSKRTIKGWFDRRDGPRIVRQSMCWRLKVRVKIMLIKASMKVGKNVLSLLSRNKLSKHKVQVLGKGRKLLV